MTEHIKQQVSLFLDDELSREECEFFVRRLQRDRESRNLYLRYQMIGAALRGEHINSNHTILRQRLQHALTAPTATTSATGKLGALAGGAMKTVVGAGIAASVAAAAIFFLRAEYATPGAETSRGLPMAVQRLERVEPPSYVVPLQVPAMPVVKPEIRLTGLQYLMHHGGHASSLGRTVVHANVLAADSQDIVAVAEETAAP